MDLRAALEIVGKWGTALEKQQEGWARLKAVLFVVGAEDWNAAAALGDAMGVHPDDQEAIFNQIRRDKETNR